MNLYRVVGIEDNLKKKLLDNGAVIMAYGFSDWLKRGKIRPTEPSEMQRWITEGYNVLEGKPVYKDGSSPKSNQPEPVVSD